MLKLDYISSIPKEVFANEALTASDRLVLMVLISLQRYNCYANGYTGGLQEIADTLHFSVRTIKRSIVTLKELGIISTIRSNGGNTVIKVTKCPQQGTKSPLPGDNMSPSEGQFVPNPSDNMSPATLLDKDKKEKNKIRGEERAHEAISLTWGAYGGWYEGKFRTMYVPTEEERVQCQQIATHIATMYERTFKTEPTPQQVADSLVKWMETAYANANEWQRKHWSLRIIIKDFNQLNAKINERQSSTLGDAARSAIARYLNGCGSSGVDGQADKQ